MTLTVLGLNHTTAPLNVREKVSFSDMNRQNAYSFLKSDSRIKEGLILSTCNRVEIYGIGVNACEAAHCLKTFLYREHELRSNRIDQHLYTLSHKEAFRHLIRVASGLGSMVIGENQILNQIKRAYIDAQKANMISSQLHHIVQEALRLGKKVRTETNISKGVTSFPGAVCEIIKVQNDLIKKRVLVIGAGKVGRITVKKLSDLGVQKIVVCNRHKENVAPFKDHQIDIGDFTNLKEEAISADIIIAATASPHYLINKAMLENRLMKDDQRLLLFDLGVPRNIESDLNNYSNVSLYNIDELGRIIEQTMASRQIEAKKANTIIENYLCDQLSLV